MTVTWVEPCHACPEEPVICRCSDVSAVATARAAFEQARPGEHDPRTDDECLQDFITVHWAHHDPSDTLRPLKEYLPPSKLARAVGVVVGLVERKGPGWVWIDESDLDGLREAIRASKETQ